MKLGGHLSAETRAKQSAANMGRVIPTETRAKTSATLMGHAVSPETRSKISAANTNPSPETRAKISAAGMGRVQSSETRAKESARMMGNTYALGHHLSEEHKEKIFAAVWKGGPQVYRRKGKAKHRLLGFHPLNSPFEGCEGHHINKVDVIYMPKDIHQGIYHNIWTGQNMDKINTLAGQYLTEVLT